MNITDPNPHQETSLLDELKLGYNDLSYGDKEKLHDWIIAKRIEETKDRLASKVNEVGEDAKDLLNKGASILGTKIATGGNKISDLVK